MGPQKRLLKPCKTGVFIGSNPSIFFFLGWIGYSFHVSLDYQKSAKSMYTLPFTINYWHFI